MKIVAAVCAILMRKKSTPQIVVPVAECIYALGCVFAAFSLFVLTLPIILIPFPSDACYALPIQ